MSQPPQPTQPTHLVPPTAAWAPGGWDQPPAGIGWAPPGPHGSYNHEPSDSRPTNAFAIVALILGIIGGPLLGLIFGLIALHQIRRSGENGRRLAIAGVILSGIWIGLLAVIVAAAIIVGPTTTAHSSPSTGTTTTAQSSPSTGTVATDVAPSGDDMPVNSLQVGDCINDLQTGTIVKSLPTISCTQAHQGEVFAVFDLPGGPFPGSEDIRATVSAQCSSRFDDYTVGVSAPEMDVSFIYPQQQNWDAGDRQVTCIADRPNGGTTAGSIRGV